MGGGSSGVALIMNVASLFLNFSGLITGPLLKTCTPRAITIIGSSMVAFGLMISSVTNQLWQLLITYSFFVGVGLGLIVPSSFMAINQYFTTKKGRAVGLSVAGTGLGQIIMPHVVRILLENFGFNTAVLVMGCLALNGIGGGSLFRPLMMKGGIDQIELVRDMSVSVDENANNQGEKKRKQPVILIFLQRAVGVVIEKMDLKLFKEFVFISLTIGLALAYTCSTNFSMIYPFILQVSVTFILSKFLHIYYDCTVRRTQDVHFLIRTYLRTYVHILRSRSGYMFFNVL